MSNMAQHLRARGAGHRIDTHVATCIWWGRPWSHTTILRVPSEPPPSQEPLKKSEKRPKRSRQWHATGNQIRGHLVKLPMCCVYDALVMWQACQNFVDVYKHFVHTVAVKEMHGEPLIYQVRPSYSRCSASARSVHSRLKHPSSTPSPLQAPMVPGPAHIPVQPSWPGDCLPTTLGRPPSCLHLC